MGARDQPFSCVVSAWRDHEGELLGYLRHRLGDAEAAADVLQDVFVKALRQGQGFCRLDNQRAWLFQVARNAMVDRARGLRVHDVLTPELLENLPLEAEPEPAPIDALAGCLSRTIGELAAADADVLRACDLEGETQRSFAARNKLSLPAVKSRLLRARERLRERMVQDCRIERDSAGHVIAHVARATPAPD